MLPFLSPAGLWALAALALPLAIHLWRRPPRTVRLGSLRFLETLPRRWRDLRWRERTLLAARLGLLALLAILVAGPLWQARPPRGPQRWTLLDPTAAHAVAPRGARWLAPGFPPSTSTVPDRAAPDLWSLLREVDAELPAGSVLTVLSPGRLTALRGTRPALRHCRVEWVQTPDVPSPLPPVQNPAPVRVGIFHDPDRATDARFMEAALRATGRAVEIVNPKECQWLIWLSARPAPGGNVLREAAAGREDPTPGWIVAPLFLDPVRLWKRAAAPDGPAGAVEWTDGFGQPLLTRHGTEWTFHGRFDPAWTGLMRGSALPLCLRALIWGENIPSADDHRLADPSQYRPSETVPPGPDVTLTRLDARAVDLHGALWTLAAAFFGLERFLSARPAVAR